MIRELAAAAVAGLLFAAPSAAQAQETHTIRLSDVMSPADRQAAGVDALPPAQRAALEAWLTRYTVAVATGARLAQAGAATVPGQAAFRGEPPSRADRLNRESLSFLNPPAFEGDTTRPARGASRRRLAFGPFPPRTIGKGARIFRADEGSSFILLADGTMWEIYPADRPASVMWRAGDFVQVRPAPIRRGQDYEYLLVDGAQRSRVSARFAGWVRPGSDRPDAGDGGSNDLERR